MISTLDIKQADLTLVGEGFHRLVFETDHDAGILIKLSKPLQGKPVKRWAYSTFSFARNRSLFGEKTYADKINAMARAQGLTPPIADVVGFTKIDGEIAQVVERIADFDGQLSKKLQAFYNVNLMSPQLFSALNAFAASLFSLSIVATDLSLLNVVVQRVDTSGRLDIKLIDGFGDRHLIKIKYAFRRNREALLHAAMRKFAKRTSIKWQQEALRFERLN